MKTVAVIGICPMCRQKVLEGQESFKDPHGSINHADCLKGNLKIGDRVKVLIFGENEGKVGRIIGIKTEIPTCYWVRFAGPHPEIGCVWDYFWDEIEGVDSWVRI